MKIVDSDAFLDMPLSTQALYFHLNMRADDDGFVGNPKKIMRVVGASEDDLKLLIAKRFLITFDNGVIVIKHWRMHNTLSSNRYHETNYVSEKDQLLLKRNGSYSLTDGETINDAHMIEMSTRQGRRTKDGQKTDADLDLDIGLDKDIDIDINNNKKKDININNIPPISPQGEEWKFDKHTNVENAEHLLCETDYKFSSDIQMDSMLRQTIKDWLKYKDEKKPKATHHYTESGLKTLLNKFARESKEFGCKEIARIVDESMASNYSGIVWDKMRKEKMSGVEKFLSDRLGKES